MNTIIVIVFKKTRIPFLFYGSLCIFGLLICLFIVLCEQLNHYLKLRSHNNMLETMKIEMHIQTNLRKIAEVKHKIIENYLKYIFNKDTPKY